MSTTIDTIKTFGDAIAKLGKNHPYVVAYNSMNDVDECNADILAYMKLRIITAALNDGWSPTFADNEIRYYPWFYPFTEREYKYLSDDEKEDCRRVVGRSGRVWYVDMGYDTSFAYANIGSHLAFKSRVLTMYAVEQFFDEWCDFLFRLHS